ncbi:MAG: ABC transporter ATP-binding protein [Phycisphaeraceae bacterium]|nr:ABC transporter ATP-binding protein [Phycisphaeraceae bacterium]
MTSVIRTRALNKIYGRRYAVEQFDWEVAAGSAVAFLGPNGAGKTTMMRLLLGFAHPTSGTCEVLGSEPWNMPPETRMRLGYVPDELSLPLWVTGNALFDFHQSVYPKWDGGLERELTNLFQLSLHQQIGQLSKGQARQVALVLAICQSPELLLLDEPTAGLDVATRRELLGVLSSWLAEENRSLVLSTHLVNDVERIASHVCVIQQGQLVASEELESLKADIKLIRMSRRTWDMHSARWGHTERLSTQSDEHQVTLRVRRFDSQIRSLLAQIASRKEAPNSTEASDIYVTDSNEEIEVIHLSLEEIYLALTSDGESA